jgi:hypothetical protein
MAHRVNALKAIKKPLTETTKLSTSHKEASALVATCYVLTFQSVSLDDGITEYMTFIRGIVIIGMQMMFKGIKTILYGIFEEQDELLEPLMVSLPLSTAAGPALRSRPSPTCCRCVLEGSRFSTRRI